MFKFLFGKFKYLLKLLFHSKRISFMKNHPPTDHFGPFEPHKKQAKLNKEKKKDASLTDLYERIQIDSDGNCLFRAIQYCLEGRQEGYEALRTETCDHLKKNRNKYQHLFEKDNDICDFDEYLQELRKDGVWGNHLELSILSELYKFDFLLFKPNSLAIHYRHVHIPPSELTFYLEYENYNHFNVLVPKKAPLIYINLSKSQQQSKGDSQNKKVSISKKQKVMGKKENENNVNKSFLNLENTKHKKEKTISNLSFQDKKAETNALNPYPKAKRGNDTYNEVYRYFKFNLKPERILNQTSFKNWKSEIQKRYRLLNKRQNQFSQSYLQIKSNKDVFRTIPFKKEIPNLIEMAHNGFQNSETKHNGIRATLRNLEGPLMSLYWSGISSDIKEYVENCFECIQDQPVKQIKIYKPIISAGPFDRFTADLWSIPNEMLNASGTAYRYVLSCVDHFSKYKWTELVSNKDAQTIATKLEYFFNFYRPPVHFQSDNGKEFKNEIVSKLCQRKNIKMCHGKPYYPQSQGVVEKLNDLLSKSLYASLSKFKRKESKGSWDIEGALKAWTVSSNKNIHSVTKTAPLIAITLTNQQEIQQIQDRIKNYYSNKQTNAIPKDCSFKIGTKVFIIREVKKVKSKLKLIPKSGNAFKKQNKNKKVRIPAEIIDTSKLTTNIVDVKIYGKFLNDLNLDQNYSINIDYIEIPKSLRSWNILANV